MCSWGTGHADLAAQLMAMPPEEADKEVDMPPHLLRPYLMQAYIIFMSLLHEGADEKVRMPLHPPRLLLGRHACVFVSLQAIGNRRQQQYPPHHNEVLS